MAHYGYITQIKEGVVFSDPFYGPDVWCQYRKEFHDSDWLMKMETNSDDGIMNFKLYLGRPTLLVDMNVKEEGEEAQIFYPKRYETKEVELGIDTAKIFCGSMENWEQFKEEAAIKTGADGLFGDLFPFTCKGEEDPAGFLLMGSVDEMLISEDELFRHFVSGFDGQEISRDTYDWNTNKSVMSLKVAISNEERIARAHEAQNMGKEIRARDSAKDEPER